MTDRIAAADGPRRPSSSLLLAWTLRLLLLAGAAAALCLALWQSPPDQPGMAFVCPMHPQVRSPLAGRCPICNMALTAAPAAGAPAGEEGPALAPNDLHTVRTYLFPAPTRAPAWIDSDGTVLAVFYRDEARELTAGASATYASALAPQAGVPVTLEEIPARAWDAETVQLRFRLDVTPAHPAGEIGEVDVPLARHPVVAVEEALVFTDDAGRRYVLVPAGDGRSFERRLVEIGRVINGRAVILAGLAAGDRIVRRRAFFLDADLRSREVSRRETSPP